MIDIEAALDELRRRYELLGPDSPDLATLLAAVNLALSRAEGDSVTVPRWVLAELARNLGRHLADEGMLAGGRKRRPSERKSRPLGRARRGALHLERWHAITLERALHGGSVDDAIARVSDTEAISTDTLWRSYKLVERLRKFEPM